MYTHENYLWGLVVYAAGFLLILPMLLTVTRAVIPWRIPRGIIRLFFVALLLTPVQAYNGMYFLAPAWMVAVFEFVRPTSVEGPARALTPMVVVFVALIAAYCAWCVLYPYWRKRRERQV